VNDDGRNVPYYPLKLVAVEEGWEAYNPVEAVAYLFNAHTKHLLALCDGYNTLPEIVATISAQYGLAPADCRDSVAAILDPLTEAGMVWWRAQRVQPTQFPPPQSVFWELTWRCNLRCIHCVVSGGEREGEEPTTRELKGIAWQLARAGVKSVAYSGGEPLLRPDFFEIAEHVAGLGMSAQVATNGLLVDEELAARLARLGISAQITISSATPASHDAFTGVRGSWDKSMGAIRLLVDAGMHVTVATIATTMSAPDVPAIVDLVAGMGVPSYRLIPFVPSGRGRRHRKLELSLDAMRRLTILLRQVRASGRIGVLPLEFEEALDPPPDYRCDPSSRIGCDGAVGYCTIGTTGEVLPCSFFGGVECDSLRDRPFEWIWANSRFLNYFRSLNVSDLEGECAACSHLAVCRGGCRATNHSIGALFAGNAHCWAACGG
jgi:radical SAM protein with 4Fe4S-binding SPASM domain